MALTAKDIKHAAAWVEERAQKLGRIETQEQADRQNELDKALGAPWSWKWKVGDEYYEVSRFQHSKA